jgi:hypothetical protein
MVLKLVGSIVGVLVIAIIAVVALAYFGVIPVPGLGGSKPENTAQYFPDDVLAYSWFTLNPGGGQRAEMLDIWERFDELDGFHDAVQDLLDELREETNIDFEEDILPWIGPDMSAALLDIGSFDPSAVAIVGVRDASAAADFMDLLIDYGEEEGSDFIDDSEGDFDIWLDSNNEGHFALSNNWLVVATDEDALFDTLDMISGNGGRSLANNPDFQEAQAALPDRRFASVYADYAGIGDELGAGSGFGLIPYGVDSFGIETPEWVAMSFQWVDRGLVVDMVSPTTTDSGLEIADLDNPARVLPADTLGFVASAFDPSVDNWRNALGDYPVGDLWFLAEALDEIDYGLSDFGVGGLTVDPDDSLADVLDTVIDVVANATGVDLELDFMDYLGGEIIIGVREFDFQEVADDPETKAVDAMAMISYRSDSQRDLQDTMDVVVELVEEYSFGVVSAEPVDVGAEDDAIVLNLDALGFSDIAYSPGYVLHDGYMTLASTEDALVTIVDVQNGDADSLTSDGEYQRAIGHIIGIRQGMGYVNFQLIIQYLDPDELDMDFDEFEILETGLGGAAFGAHQGEEYSRFSFVVTLFPE